MIKKFLKNSCYLLLFNALAAPLAYLFRLLLAKNLSLLDYGLFYAILNFLSLIGAFNDFGFSETQAFFIPKYVVKKRFDKIKAVIKVQLINQVLTTLVISLIIFVLSDFLALKIFHHPSASLAIRVSLLFFIAQDFLLNIKTLFYAFQEAQFYGSSEFLKSFLALPLLFLTLIFFNQNLVSILLLWGLIAVTMAIFYFGLFFYKHRQVFIAPKFSIKKIYLEFLPWLIPTVLSNNFRLIFQTSTNTLLVFFKGLEVVALYNIAQPIANILTVFLRPIANLLMPIISQASTQKDEAKIKTILLLILNAGVFLLLPLPLLLSFYAQDSIIFLFGSKFIGASWTLRVFAFYLFFNILNSFLAKFLLGLGLHQKRVKLLLLTSVINFILSLFFIPLLGATGAILANSCGEIVLIIGALLLTKNKIKFNLPYKNYFKIIILALCFIIINLVFKLLTHHNLLIQFILFVLKAGLGLGIYYFLGIFVLQIVNWKFVVKLLKNYLPQKWQVLS